MKKTILLCVVMLVSMGFVHAEGKFYLKPSVEQWGMANAVFGATFKDASDSESEMIRFVSTEANPYIYELDIPDGDWIQIKPGRYAPNWDGEYHTEVGYLSYGTNNFITIVGWAETHLSTYTPPVLSAVKFYLDITGSDWAGLSDSFYKAIFQDSDNSAIYEVVFKPTAVPTIYEVKVPVGNINALRVERYLIQTQASSGGDQGEDYAYNGTLNCATVTGWSLNAALTTYTEPAPGEEITIRYKKPAGWTAVNIHVWDNSGESIVVPDGMPDRWFGVPMTAESDGWYSFSILKDELTNGFHFQFNSGDMSNYDDVRDDDTMSNVAVNTDYNEDGSIYTNAGTSTKLPEFVSNVYVSGNQIIASFEGSASIELYTATGQLLHAEQGTHNFVRSAAAGIYLLNINGKVHKVLVP